MSVHDFIAGNGSDIADELDKTARGVRDVVWRLEDPAGGINDDIEAKTELEFWLARLYIQVAIALDHLGLAASRADLMTAWNGFEQSGLLNTLKYYPGPGVIGCGAYDYLDAVIGGIRAIEPKGNCPPTEADPLDKGELLKLEKLLDRTAYIVQKRSSVPKKEKDIQCVMDEYLECIYGADYHRQFSIPGVVKNFRPDSGIRSLETVIEFKFADSQEELKTATAGLFEDAAGYKASKDWRRFYSVIYMTGAYGTKEQLLADFGRTGMVDWTPILVTGQGERKIAEKKRANAKSKSQ